ncbi:hypothetical protein COJ96_24115 [Bacillus sp. AFS073361]|uniref:hypothetical protein n=1 Tax=Bacillus sp. AFS073361 TaxID=2033511 RepID=UPI000BF2895B|nr:hypothetical protein [Bacillus sp. AFS073361]PFP23492.1 hypothetical protein COJ96_24115 [Bacillus sp. AFS073361]
MRAVNLRIEGEYWEFLIKYNKLFLWNLIGEVEIYNWEEILRDTSIKYGDSIYSLYNGSMKNKIFIEKDINCFNRDNNDIYLSKNYLERYLEKKVLTPNEEVITSINSFNDNLIINTDDGLFISFLDNMERFEKITDMPFYNISVGTYGRVAFAAGEEGIFELLLPPNHNKDYKGYKENFRNVIKKHSNKTSWVKNNIYSSSYLEEFILNPRNLNKKYYDENQIFKHSVNEEKAKVTWVNNNKIYRKLNSSTLEEVTVLDLGAGELSFKSRILNFQVWKGEIISGAGTAFGTIVECENAMVIIFKDTSVLNIPGEVVRWKSYRSNERYSNILGIIYEEELVLSAFNY